MGCVWRGHPSRGASSRCVQTGAGEYVRACVRVGRPATLTSGAYTRTGGDRRRGGRATSLDGAPTIPVVTAPGRDRGVAPATFAFQSLQVHERHAAAVRRARAATRIQVGHVVPLGVPTTASVVVPVAGVRAPDACARDNVRRRAKGHCAGIVRKSIYNGKRWVRRGVRTTNNSH